MLMDSSFQQDLRCGDGPVMVRGRPEGEPLRPDLLSSRRSTAVNARPSIRAWHRIVLTLPTPGVPRVAEDNLRRDIGAVGQPPRGGVRSGALSDERVTICDAWFGRQDPRIPTEQPPRPPRVAQLYSMQSLALNRR